MHWWLGKGNFEKVMAAMRIHCGRLLEAGVAAAQHDERLERFASYLTLLRSVPVALKLAALIEKFSAEQDHAKGSQAAAGRQPCREADSRLSSVSK